MVERAVTETVSEDGDGSNKGIEMSILEQLHYFMKTFGKDMHELDCWAREKGFEGPLWEGLVSKTKGEAIERPGREALVSGGKFGDGMIGAQKHQNRGPLLVL